MPISTLGTTDTNGFMNMNDIGVGVMKLFMSEEIPNISPTMAPTKGPSTIAPIMTGMCIVVTFARPIGMNPSGVNPSTTEIAPSIPVIVIFFVLPAANPVF